MSKPIVATVATFAFIGTWNDYVWPTMVLPSPLAGEWDWLPIQAAITSIEARNPTTGEMMAALVITSIPIFLVYTFAQKYIVQGSGASGIENVEERKRRTRAKSRGNDARAENVKKNGARTENTGRKREKNGAAG